MNTDQLGAYLISIYLEREYQGHFSIVRRQARGRTRPEKTQEGRRRACGLSSHSKGQISGGDPVSSGQGLTWLYLGLRPQGFELGD
jgi:hypothetical protein